MEISITRKKGKKSTAILEQIVLKEKVITIDKFSHISLNTVYTVWLQYIEVSLR